MPAKKLVGDQKAGNLKPSYEGFWLTFILEPEELDPRSLAEAVDVVAKLPTGLQTNLTSSKWKERKEALDDLLVVLKAALRIKDAPELGELAKSLATRVQGDANVNCVMVAANCLEALANGLTNAFARHREAVVPPMLERLKERKANITDTIGAALDAVFKTVGWFARYFEDKAQISRRQHSPIS